jgi:hypothetical protein
LQRHWQTGRIKKSPACLLVGKIEKHRRKGSRMLSRFDCKAVGLPSKNRERGYGGEDCGDPTGWWDLPGHVRGWMVRTGDDATGMKSKKSGFSDQR